MRWFDVFLGCSDLTEEDWSYTSVIYFTVSTCEWFFFTFNFLRSIFHVQFFTLNFSRLILIFKWLLFHDPGTWGRRLKLFLNLTRFHLLLFLLQQQSFHFFIFFSFFFSTDFHLPIWLWVFIVQIRIRFFAGKELTWFPFEVPFILRLPLVRVLSEVDQMKNNDCVTLKIFLKILNSFENARFNRYCTQKWFEKRLRVVI